MSALFAHHIGPNRRVRDLGHDVHREWNPVQVVEVLRERLPLPANALDQREAGDLLDALHHANHELAFVGPGRREADTAVAHHGSGHPVRRGRIKRGVPGHLSVVVRVPVHNARCHDLPVGVDLPARRSGLAAHLREPTGIDGQIAREALPAAAIDNQSVPNHEVVHEVPSWLRPRIIGQMRAQTPAPGEFPC